MAGKTALVAGATGLVGGALVRVLVESGAYERVTALVRRPLSWQHPRLQQVVANYDRLGELGDLCAVDDLYCCLGTTIKQAGSQAAFRRVDLEYPLALAKLARAHGVRQYLIVTALGANPSAGVFYNRVKGEVEVLLGDVGLPALQIFRPSILTGPRAEFRLGERVGITLMGALAFLLPRRYRPIAGLTVARAMLAVARRGGAGVHIYPSDQIAALGARG